MSLVRYNRNRPTRGFDSFFDNFFNNNLTDFIGSDERFTAPSVNIIENEEDYRIEVAAPGLSKEHFNVNIEENVLTISAEHQENKEESKDKYTRREFSYSSFKRSFNLPETIEDGKVSAKYENGVLYLNLPKKEEAKPQPARRIEIG